MACRSTLSSFLTLFLFLLLASAPYLVSSARCNKDDKKALLAIKAAFNNAYHFASWTNDTGCCDWYDVDCDPKTGRVTGLSLFQDDFPGTIPDAVGDLPYLENLVFHHLPNLVGSIPPALTKLKNLKYLDISWTNVSGPVPAFLSEITSLTQLDLSFNRLSGSIPASLGDLANLSSIDISRNHLTGPLPPALFQRSSQQGPYLRLSHNNLTGEIPPAFGKLGFDQIDLSRNQFTGDASVLFGRSKPAQQIDLSRNQFAFDLTNVEFPEGLDSVDLNHNRIYGSIPNQITKLANLQFFNVSYNRLCGEIPVGGNMGRFDEYCYLHNKCLCGTPLPPCK
ncbi:polygalacturonase inhibitor-like [Phoenix dactylifera]|uniref:Polygalacturonase inhibitor-like n=1 Tax=Phoenix dactylifera TaxID=42345 RepID=A0A8B8ZQY5_PHODC|nr:polygalacturonase inhibitor-like [Phoenix dactylifera]XP_038976685.1 polygalacturonase inhibitor-like [Phoenix dactylifera]